MIVLGISGGIGHDGSACLVKDGKILCALEEERVIRRKRASRTPPVASASFCLQQAGISMDEVDVLALAWDPSRCKNMWPRDYVAEFINHPFMRRSKPIEIVPVDHHISHLVAAHAHSGFAEATALIVDGQGEDCATTVAHVRGKEISVLERYPVSQSLGYFYLGVLRYLGLGRTESGKLMGLASFGQDRFDLPIRMNADGYSIPIDDPEGATIEEQNDHVISWWIRWLESHVGKAALPSVLHDPIKGRIISHIPFEQLNVDLAASAQARLEEALMSLVQAAVRRTGCRNLVLGGGVALNCSANGVLARSGLVDRISVFPASGDGGASVGAALYVDGTYNPGESSLDHAYFGPEYADGEIVDTLRGLGLKYEIHDRISDAVSDLLADNRVVGWFQHRMELGPRALGARSIVAHPGVAENLRRINRSVKFREPWRPLAPSFLAEHIGEYVEHPMNSPFMLFAFHTRDEKRDTIPAVVHVDGTTRPQTVNRDTNARYRDLIEAFYRKTGIPAVLNTSFNLDAEPIVCTPIDAIRTFFASDLDALAIGSALIRKNRGRTGGEVI